jgi:hypothetical protein
LTIDYLSEKTFIAKDSITLHASIGTPTPGVQVLWTVQGQGAAADIAGFPTNFVTTTDTTGTATFTFIPEDNQNFVVDRRTTWTNGSSSANPAISFDVTATATLDGQKYTSKLSDTELGPLTQDTTDILREEYYDYSVAVPDRDQFVASLGSSYNSGNYNIQLNVDMPVHYAAILAAYRGQQVIVTIAGQPYTTVIPNTATISINSAYRSPQHNKWAKSTHPDSKHTLGRAFDLKPDPFSVIIMVNGHPMRVTVPLDQTLYPALYAAAAPQGFTQAEKRGVRVPVGTTGEDHIHVQW